MSLLLEAAMRAALAEAEKCHGATAPNPPVGAAALDSQGKILAVAAHEGAGKLHAEAKLIQTCAEKRVLDQVHTLVVTLEPCNHRGRTPACTEAILKAQVPCVVYGVRDPNPRVKGGGADFLKSQGVQVIEGVLQEECGVLVRSFSKWVQTGLPWIVIKRAWTRDGSMIPPTGKKTFTSEDSLRFAHELRRRADAILTGSGTVLADLPEFTVRRVPDHSGKVRELVVLDRRGRVPRTWMQEAEKRGFRVSCRSNIQEALQYLGNKGCLEVLVEAGPSLSQAMIDLGFCDQVVDIHQKE